MSPNRLTLILSENPYPLNTGGKVIVFERLKILSAQYDIQLFVLNWSPDEKKGGEQLLSSLCVELHFIDAKVDLSRNFISFDKFIYMANSIFRLSPKFNFVFGNKIERARVSCQLNKFGAHKIAVENLQGLCLLDKSNYHKLCYFAHNVEFSLIAGKGAGVVRWLLSFWESFKVRRYETRAILKAAKVIFFSERDRNFFVDNLQLNEQQQSRLIVIPPLFEISNFNQFISDNPRKGDYVFLPTNADWMPNIESLTWFFEQVYPTLDRQIKILISGRDRNGFLHGLALKYVNVEYIGMLDRPEYEKCLSCAGLFVNPTITGSGFQIKLIEAAAFNVPIVSTKFSNLLSEEIPSSDSPELLGALINKWNYNELSYSFNYGNFYQENFDKLFQALS